MYMMILNNECERLGVTNYITRKKHPLIEVVNVSSSSPFQELIDNNYEDLISLSSVTSSSLSSIGLSNTYQESTSTSTHYFTFLCNNFFNCSFLKDGLLLIRELIYI